MSLRKSPTLTPALLASNRANAKKSMGPRTAQGKAWSRLNRMRHGGRSTEYIALANALLYARPGRVAETACALLSCERVQHLLFLELAEASIQAEMGICKESRGTRKRPRR